MKPLIAGAAAIVIAATAAILYVLSRNTTNGPDAFAGVYPQVTAAPTGQPALTWKPTSRPAGPLPVFPGPGTRIIGRATNRHVGLSYARFGPPWKNLRTGDLSTAQQFDSKKKTLKGYWYASIKIEPLDPKLDKPGPQRLRAAAELTGAAFVRELYSGDGARKDLAGAAMTVDHHQAWVTAFRMTHTDKTLVSVEKSQTEVVLAVDTGRGAPAIVEITIPGNQPRVLPDINRLVHSLRVLP